MTAHLSAEEVAEFREIFNLVDRVIPNTFTTDELLFLYCCKQDGGGSISKDELAELMDTLGIEITTEELDAMVRE